MQALHIAAKNGEIEVVKSLLRDGADIDAKHRSGETPLYMAALCGGEEVVKFLVMKGADIEAEDTDGYTPLMCASVAGKWNISVFLIGEGAMDVDKICAENEGHEHMLNDLMDCYNRSIPLRTKDGWRPWLHESFPKRCRDTIVTFLMLAKASNC